MSHVSKVQILALFVFATNFHHSYSQPVTQLPPLNLTEKSDAIEVPKKDFSRDLVQEVLQLPNTMRAGGSNRSRFLQIRGLGDRSQFEHSQVNPVGVFYEGIDLSEEASALPLMGQEKTFLHYGPQTQAWGSKAIAGSIEVKHCLNQCNRLDVSGELSSFETRSLSAGYSPSDYKKLYVGGKYLESDGVYHNTFLDRATQTQSEKSLVFGGEYQLDVFSLRHFHLLADHDNGYDAWNFDRSFNTLSDHPGRDRHFVHGHSLFYESSHKKWWGLTSLTSTQQLESYDEDWGNNPYWQNISGWNQNYNYYSQFERERFKIHQKLAYDLTPQTEVGLHYYSYDEKQIINSFKDEALRRSVEPSTQSKQVALWLKKEWKLNAFNFLSSLRGESQWVGLSPGQGRALSAQHNLWGARLEVDQNISPRLTVNYLLERSYRGGGYNTDPDLLDSQKEFGSETLYYAQLGLFAEFETLSFFVRGFTYWYQDQQVRSSVQLDPMDPSSYNYLTSNRGQSKVEGLEVSVSHFYGDLKLAATGGLLNSEYQDYNLAGRKLSGRDLPHAPNWNYQLGAQYDFTQSLNFSLQYSAYAEFYYSEDHDQKSPPWDVLDASISYSSDAWRLSVWGRNLLNETYTTRGYYFANEPPDWETRLYTQRGLPQSFGLELRYRL